MRTQSRRSAAGWSSAPSRPWKDCARDASGSGRGMDEVSANWTPVVQIEPQLEQAPVMLWCYAGLEKHGLEKAVVEAAINKAFDDGASPFEFRL